MSNVPPKSADPWNYDRATYFDVAIGALMTSVCAFASVFIWTVPPWTYEMWPVYPGMPVVTMFFGYMTYVSYREVTRNRAESRAQ